MGRNLVGGDGLLIPSRRSFLGLLTAPAIVHAANIMPVKAFGDFDWIRPSGEPLYLDVLGRVWGITRMIDLTGPVNVMTGLPMESDADFRRRILARMTPGRGIS